MALRHSGEWDCDDCKLTHMPNQLSCLSCNKPNAAVSRHNRIRESEMKMDNDNVTSQQEKYKIGGNMAYKEVNRGLIKCNGDCGSQFAKLIEDIVNNKSKGYEMEAVESMISIMFRYFNDPLRRSLLSLMRKRGLFQDKYSKYYEKLNDERYYVKIDQVKDVIDLFKILVNDNHKDILQQIASQTCRDPSWSLLEQISYGRLYELKEKYKGLQETISIFQDDKDIDDKKQNEIVLKALNDKTKKIKEEIENEEKKVKQQSNLNYYFKRLEQIKIHPKYKKMEEQNCELNDLEILSILFYCDVDMYCREMHKTHRDKDGNSCKWSNLFYHCCSGIDKIWRVFHKQKKNGLTVLFSGSTISDLNQESKQELHLKTLTSFTTSCIVAQSFARKKKNNKTDKEGMIFVIDDANNKLKDGSLRAADVSWISMHKAEDEYLILPTTFRNFKYVPEQERIDNDWIIGDEYNMYITSNVESMDISQMIQGIDNQLDAPMTWLPADFRYYNDMRISFDSGLSILGLTIGHFRYIECMECHILSRIMDFNGKWSNLSIECPCCRVQIFRTNNKDDRHRTFKCYNTKCKSDSITRQDLRKINESNKWGLDPEDGYQCIHCKKQQKITYLNNLANNEEIIDKTADQILKSINTVLELNAKHTGNGDIMTARLDPTKYKNDLKKMISFFNKKENIHSSLSDIIKEFPIIWNWITSCKPIKIFLDSYKNGYHHLLNEGHIDTSNDTEKYKHVGIVIKTEISKINSVQEAVNITKGILDGIMTNTEQESDETDNNQNIDEEDEDEDNVGDGDSDNDNNNDDNGVWYNCPQCSERVYAVRGFEGVNCVQCQAKTVTSFFSNLF